MAERIKLTGGDSPADMFLIEAMVAVDDSIDSFMPDLKSGNHEVEVVLTINGKEAPFASVARGFFERGQAAIEAELLDRAKSLVTAAGLDGILRAMQEAEWRIESSLVDALIKRPTP